MNVDAAQKSYDAAEAGLVAQEDGIVASVDVVEGAYANETQTVMTIIRSDSIGVEVSVSKDDLASIRKGQKVRIAVLGSEYDGTVEFISRVASMDETAVGNNAAAGGNIKVRVRIKKPDDALYIGVSAKAYIFVGEAESVPVIPYEALNTDVDGDYVYIVGKDDRIERRDVRVGLYSDEYYEILEGVKKGEKVIRSVTKDMKPGDVYSDVSTGDTGGGTGLSVSVE